MQQRVGLARALAVEPEVLFFDEPFSALDPLIRRDMQNELLRLQHDLHRTIVFITHDFAEAIKLGDRIAIMKDGVFDQIGTAAELIMSPATDYVGAFVRDVPKAKVLTAGDIARAGVGGDRRVLAGDLVETLIPRLLDDPDSMTVVGDGGTEIGVVDPAAVAARLTGGPARGG
jgi:glycine betaine/proline transport system ATP-binding protein